MLILKLIALVGLLWSVGINAWALLKWDQWDLLIIEGNSKPSAVAKLGTQLLCQFFGWPVTLPLTVINLVKGRPVTLRYFW